MSRKIFTSESVTEGHPDKVCDQISDAILDAAISIYPFAHVACETFATKGLVVIGGETNQKVPVVDIARQVIRDIGYDSPELGFSADDAVVLDVMNEQSEDIAKGVEASYEIRTKQSKDRMDQVGAGDQGIMFGFACDETPELMPAPIQFAHELTHRLAVIRKEHPEYCLRPDGKAQVTVEYDDNGKVACIPTIVISTQHEPEHGMFLRDLMIDEVVKKVIPSELLVNTEYLVNPTGNFVIGGPAGDTGLTGRKIVVDTYGGYAPHGGGAFSGKDPTKVDRSAAYMARYIAKNVVAAGLAHKCQVQLGYAIGVAHPVSLRVDTFGTGLDDEWIEATVEQVFDLRPQAIIEKLKLQQPIYRQTAAYGHFGRTDIILPWEQIDMVDALKNV